MNAIARFFARIVAPLTLAAGTPLTLAAGTPLPAPRVRRVVQVERAVRRSRPKTGRYHRALAADVNNPCVTNEQIDDRFFRA